MAAMEEASQPGSAHSLPDTQESFGWLLRRYRLAAGLTQEELAERAGVSVKGLSVLETGKRKTPYRHTITLLVKALGLTASEAAALEAAISRVRAAAPTARGEGAVPAGAVLAVVPAPLGPRTNFPEQPTSFIGREREQAEVAALLGRAPLVTLTGAGGCGKTRLALMVADKLLGEYPDGVWLVELAALADPTLVPQSVAHALGLKEQPGQTPMELLSGYLKHRRLLLVIDNCEHLVGTCADLATALLRSCPQIRLLATSREALEVAGEVRYQVPPLTMPDLDHLPPPNQLAQYEAVQLFLERAQARRADFALSSRNAKAVVQVCVRLDGLPLAIELAAARVGVLPVETIAARLDDRFRLLTGGPRTALPRQQTLRATLDWSHALLSPSEQALLRRLAVFAGGWILEAAEAVCADEVLAEREILDLLSALVNKSLVQMEDIDSHSRHMLLETVRQYAGEHLQASGEEVAARDQHLGWCLALAEEAEPALVGPEKGLWLARLDQEHDNLRAALRWAGSRGKGESGLRLAGALWRFWSTRGYLSEGRGWLEAALASSGPAAPLARARALDGAGKMASFQGDNAAAVTLYEEVLALRRELGDTQGSAESLISLGQAAYMQDDHARGIALQEEGLALFRELGDKQGIATSLYALGDSVRGEGDYVRAAALFEESLALSRALADRRGSAFSLDRLGLMAFLRGDCARAEALHQESLALRHALGDRHGSAWSLLHLGLVAQGQGDYARAEALHQESVALARELGDKHGIAESLDPLSSVAVSQGDYTRAAALIEEALAQWRDLGSTFRIAATLNNLGRVAHRQGDYGRAAALHEESLGLARELGHKPLIGASLGNLGRVASARGDHGGAVALREEAQALYRELRNKWLLALALDDLGCAAYECSDYGQAAALLEEALALYRELGTRFHIATALNHLGCVAYQESDCERAAALLGESLALSQELGNKAGIARSLGNLGMVAAGQGDHAQAMALFRKALVLSCNIGAKEAIAEGLERLTRSAMAQDKPEQAAQLGGSAEALREALGILLPLDQRVPHDQALQAIHSALDEDAFAAAWAEGRALALDQAVALALEDSDALLHGQ
jgi:non-specific serine/threonine protein kinase